MKNNLVKLVALATFGSSLAGCVSLGANTEKDFLCSAQIGSPCATISEVDASSTTKVTPIAEQAEDSVLANLHAVTGLTGKEAMGISNIAAGQHSYDGARYRLPETISKLWIAPYLDENQILHEGRFVHFVLTPARWVNR